MKFLFHDICKITAAIAIAMACNSCAIVRGTAYNKPSVGDRNLFASYHYDAMAEPHLLERDISDPLQMSPEFMKNTHTLAYIVVRDGALISESYAEGFGPESETDLFSISKSIVSLLLGIAIGEGKVGGIYDKVGDYLPDIDPRLGEIKLADLLDMCSGIDNTFWLKTRHYYGFNLRRSASGARVASRKAGRFAYSDCSTQLLSMVIEAATEQPITEYFRVKLWEPLGMEYSGSWSYDSKKHKNARAFCGLNMTARDVVKIGLLCLDEGRYNRMQIVPARWIGLTTQLRHDGPTVIDGYYYNNHWRVVSSDRYFAKGLFGQYLYIDRSNNTVIVRLGTKEGGVKWIEYFAGMATAEPANAPIKEIVAGSITGKPDAE